MFRIHSPSKRTRMTAGLAALTYGLLATLSWTPACSGTTGGKQVTLETEVEGSPEMGESFTTGVGWTLAVDRALVSVGPLRYVEGVPVGASAWMADFGLGRAFAHPGHYQEGGTVGESPGDQTVDLLDAPTSLGLGPGVTGTALSGEFTFEAPPEGRLASKLDGALALVEGSARKDDATYAFVLRATEEHLAAAGGSLVVLGCPFEGGDIGGNGIVSLTVDLAVWLDQVEFDELGDLDGPEVPEDGRAHKAFVRGLLKANAYSFTFTPGEPS